MIRYRTADRAAQMARDQRIAAWQLAEIGVVDVVVPDMTDAAQEPESFLKRLSHTVSVELDQLLQRDEASRLATRARRYRGGLNVD